MNLRKKTQTHVRMIIGMGLPMGVALDPLSLVVRCVFSGDMANSGYKWRFALRLEVIAPAT